MNSSQIYVLTAIVVLAAIAILMAVVGKGQSVKKLSPLASVAFAFVVAAIAFGRDNRIIGYSLIGIGIVLSIVDIVRKSGK